MEKMTLLEDQQLWREARSRIDCKTKPTGSLGLLEKIAVQLCCIQNTLEPQVQNKRILVFAASHGITEEGVSAYPASVTGQMVLNFLQGGAAINVLARHGNIKLQVVDIGVDSRLLTETPLHSELISRPIRRGTRNFLKQPAMTLEETQQAIQIGRQQAQKALKEGVQLLGIGEMGIGNTTSASALLAGLFQLSPETIVGHGTGVNTTTFHHKIEVVRKALKIYSEPSQDAPFYWLACVGGYEIAAMVGVTLECVQLHLPLVVDGFIATAAAAVAYHLEPRCHHYCFFSHRSAEQGHARILELLQAEPILNLNMRLGEGTGVALAMPIIEAAAKIMKEMATFESAGVSDKTKLS